MHTPPTPPPFQPPYQTPDPPRPQPPAVQPTPTKRLSPFRRTFLLAIVALLEVGCMVGTSGLVVGLRTGALALPPGVNALVLEPRPDGYLLNTSHDAIFITFTSPQQQGDTSGTVDVAHIDRDAVSYFHDQSTWTGTESGTNLTMFFVNGVTWRAVWQRTNLEVTYPTTGGVLVTNKFVPATTSDYENAEFALQRSAQ